MKIAVCVKQVPASSVPMDETQGVLMRSMAGGTINPWDLHAIEAALQVAEQTGGTVTAISMGPASAEQTVRVALAMGANKGVLLCDNAFAGADVYATAFTLSQGLSILGNFDLIVCGQQTTDGDTSQLPFSLATQMGIPAIGWVKKIETITESAITAKQELSSGTQRVTCPYPCLLAVGQSDPQPRIPTLKNKLRAKNASVEIIGLQGMPQKEETLYGLCVSPTRVVKVYENNIQSKKEPLKLSSQQAAACLLKELEDAQNA